MPLETDEEAIARAKGIGFLEHPDDDKRGERKAYAIFFVYMRLNRDGTFAAYRYYFEGTDQPIDPSNDPRVPHSLGYYAQDLAKFVRKPTPTDDRYAYHGSGLEGFEFPRRYSYCVFFMDDINWKFLADSDGKPTITFHETKNGKLQKKHKHAFKIMPILPVEMPINGTNNTDERHAAVMINRMRNKDNVELKDKEEESYSFDLWMRVRYANSTNGVTLIIDPGGTNLGPPKDP